MYGVYATFALREQVGGRGEPYLEYWILQDEERWHDVVRGDGGSYRNGGPSDMESRPGESLKDFQDRVENEVNIWNEWEKTQGENT